jgi:hypothetical protein
MRMLKLAALDVRLQTARGEADAALETCLDGLAFARDLSYGNAIIGSMVSSSTHGLLFFPCAEAIDRASPGNWRRAEVALRRIRAGVAPFSTSMRDERAYMPLYLAGSLFERSQLDALPAGARAVATDMSTKNLRSMDMPLILSRQAMLHAWPLIHERIGQAIAVVDLPPEQRAPRLAEQTRALMSSWNPLLGERITSYEHFTVRVDKQRAQLDLLLALAMVKQRHAELGTWPSALPTLYPGQEVLLPTALALQSGEGGTLFLHPEGQTPEELSVMATP